MAGIYIHIPFCKQACHYCDFHFSTSLTYRDDMVKALAVEIGLQNKYLSGETINTVYFGGGTPSLLSADEINLLIDAIGKLHTIAADAEITLEANPDDLNPQKIQGLKNTPVNRLSIGVQSFFDEDLIWMNRAHRSNEAESSIKRAQDAGFENITADLIYGYPLLTDEKWKHNIQQLFSLQIPHLSCYSITVEPRTALAAFIKNKKQSAMSDGQSARQFITLMDAMETAGFEHYEISNFCKPGFYSKHNSSYWKGEKYLGIGPSAHSFNGTERSWNIANNSKYLQALGKKELPAETELLTEANRLNEYIMISLRTIWGLHLQKLEQIAAGATPTLLKAAEPFFTKQWLRRDGEHLFLTRQGKLYADHVASELFF